MLTGSSPLDLFLIATAIFIVSLWWSGSAAKEVATRHAKAACRARELQLLDQTVALLTLRLGHDSQGARCLKRTYQFEFTGDNTHRDQATLVLYGNQFAGVQFPYIRHPDGSRVFSQPDTEQ